MLVAPFSPALTFVWSFVCLFSFERLVSIRDKVLELELFDPETEGQLEMSMGACNVCQATVDEHSV